MSQSQQTDWWERLYDGTPDTVAPVEQEDVEESEDQDVERDDLDVDDVEEELKKRRSRVARPRESFASWYADLSAPSRHLIYNGSAAGLGWGFGLVGLVGGWIEDCGRNYSIGAALVLGAMVITGSAVVVDMRSRGWWPPLAWVGRVPLASSVLALGLYAPASAL